MIVIYCYFFSFSAILYDLECHQLNSLVLSVHASSSIHHYNSPDAHLAYWLVLVFKTRTLYTDALEKVCPSPLFFLPLVFQCLFPPSTLTMFSRNLKVPCLKKHTHTHTHKPSKINYKLIVWRPKLSVFGLWSTV